MKYEEYASVFTIKLDVASFARSEKEADDYSRSYLLERLAEVLNDPIISGITITNETTTKINK